MKEQVFTMAMMENCMCGRMMCMASCEAFSDVFSMIDRAPHA